MFLPDNGNTPGGALGEKDSFSERQPDYPALVSFQQDSRLSVP